MLTLTQSKVADAYRRLPIGLHNPEVLVRLRRIGISAHVGSAAVDKHVANEDSGLHVLVRLTATKAYGVSVRTSFIDRKGTRSGE